MNNILTALSILGLAVSAAGTVLLFLIGICQVFGCILTEWHRRKHNEFILRTKGILSNRARWLGHEFPVVSRVIDDLFLEFNEDKCFDMSDYRKELVNIYKAKDGKE